MCVVNEESCPRSDSNSTVFCTCDAIYVVRVYNGSVINNIDPSMFLSVTIDMSFVRGRGTSNPHGFCGIDWM